jgi:lysophospholipase L1-like esterase
MKHRSRLFKILSLPVLALVFLLLLEGGLRLARWALLPEPQVSGELEQDVCSVDLLCIGDSITNGLGTEDSSGYPRRLAQLWKVNHGKPARVTSLALPGANTSEQLARMREHFDKNPDFRPAAVLVLLGFNNRWNLHDASFWEREGSTRDENLAAYLVSRLQLYKIVHLTRPTARETVGATRHVQGQEFNELRREHGWNIFFSGFDDAFLDRWIRDDLLEIARVARQRGAVPVFLTYHYERFGHLNTLIREVAGAAGAGLVDLERPQQYYEERKLLASDHMHLNLKGYDEMSRRIQAELARQPYFDCSRAQAGIGHSSPSR